jgi:hypothetical protein
VILAKSFSKLRPKRHALDAVNRRMVNGTFVSVVNVGLWVFLDFKESVESGGKGPFYIYQFSGAVILFGILLVKSVYS